MAKALFGHTSPLPDVRLLDEVGRLRRRVHELERELSDARADHQRLASSLELATRPIAQMRLAEDDLVLLSRREHASI